MNLRFLLIIPLCIILSGCESRYEELPLSEVTAADTSASETSVSEASVRADAVREDSTQKTGEPDVIYVYVCGQVMQPGVYHNPVSVCPSVSLKYSNRNSRNAPPSVRCC